MSIAKKIWLEIVIIIAGFMITTFYGYIAGYYVEKRLVSVSNEIFPATQKSKVALTMFNEQIKLYTDAVMLGDVENIENAKIRIAKVITSLELIISSHWEDDRDLKIQIIETLKKYKRFNKTAQIVYTKLASNEEEEGEENSNKNWDMTPQKQILNNIMVEASILAKQINELRTDLTEYAKILSDRLKSEIAKVKEITQYQRNMSVIVFFTVVIVASVSAHLSIKHSIMAPLNKNNWLKTGQTDLNKLIMGELRLNKLCSDILRYLIKYLDVQIGTLYVANKDVDTFILKASYSLDNDKSFNTFKIGEGVLGQVVLDKEYILINNKKKNTLCVKTSTIDINPEYILVFPLLYKNKVNGIIELGALEKFNSDMLEFIELTSHIIAVAINSAMATEELNLLFQQVNMQSNALKASKDELLHTNTELEEQAQILKKSEQKLLEQQEQLQEKNEKIIGSLRYAKMIQRSLLPGFDEWKTRIPNSFVIWSPRDIVGGDIIFGHFFEKGMMICAVVDCTGHGVPGAFMSMIASSGLRKIVSDEGYYDPAIILKKLNFFVKTSLQQDTKHAVSDDGMDMSLLLLDIKKQTVVFAGAKLPLIYIYDDKLTIIKGDKQNIGYRRSNLDFNFTNHTIAFKKGTSFYIYTDGIIDQLGGEKRRTFGTKRFKQLLKANYRESFENQKKNIYEAFYAHKGNEEIQDDVTVVGFNFDKYLMDI